MSADQRLIEVTNEIVIYRPRGIVAAFAGNPINAPEWYAGVDAVEWETPPPLAAGSRFAFVTHTLGRRVSQAFEVTEIRRGERIVMRAEEGRFPVETEYTWDVTRDGTKMTVALRAQPRGPTARILSWLSPSIRRVGMDDLRTLKALLERG